METPSLLAGNIVSPTLSGSSERAHVFCGREINLSGNGRKDAEAAAGSDPVDDAPGVALREAWQVLMAE